MKKGLVLDSGDIKKMIAEKFDVSEDCVIKSQYSYTVIVDDASVPDINAGNTSD